MTEPADNPIPEEPTADSSEPGPEDPSGEADTPSSPTAHATPRVTEAGADDPTAAAGPAAHQPSDAAPPEFAELQPGAAGSGQGSLAMLYDLMMPVSVELGRTAMSVRDVLELGRGSVIPLNRLAGEPVDIYVSDRKLAEGEVVVLGEHFGVRLTRVLPTRGGVTSPELQAQGV